MKNQKRVSEEKMGKIPAYLKGILKKKIKDWEDPCIKATRLLFEQSGILPQMVKRTPELQLKIVDFFTNDKNILVIGGESGMGKSLIAADLRRIHLDLQLILPYEQKSKLCVISWDRTHQAFFEEVSTEIGETVPLPKGETHIKARKIVSSIIGDQIQFVKKYLGENVKILVETPLIDIRGETIFNELSRYKKEVQTFIMHSPKERYEILQKGRVMPTSGQPDSMNAIREKLLYNILGNHKPISLEEQEEIIKKWWIQKLKQWNGIIVQWDPDDNRKRLKDSVNYFVETGIKPDVLSPKALSRFTRKQLESVFASIENIDDFLQTVLP